MFKNSAGCFFGRAAAFVLALSAVCACDVINRLLHDEEVLADVGAHKLYRSELSAIIPAGIPSSDSARIAKSYIDSWTLDMLFVDLAESQLSDAEKDVSKDLESYKRALLRYRYEQKYLNQRLDTAIAPAQIEEYYASHVELFRLKAPVVKAKFAVIPIKSSHIGELKKHMSAYFEGGDVLVRDSLALAYASVYNDYGGEWIEAEVLASALGMNLGEMFSSMKKGFVQSRDNKGNALIAYISDVVRRGDKAPISYCSGKIREGILSARKKELLGDLERELLEERSGASKKRK